MQLHWPIFLATCLAVMLQHKLHKSLPNISWPEMNVSRNFVVAAIVVRSRSSCNGNCNKNVLRQVLFRVQCMLHQAMICSTCITMVQKIPRQVRRKIALCNNIFQLWYGLHAGSKCLYFGKQWIVICNILCCIFSLFRLRPFFQELLLHQMKQLLHRSDHSLFTIQYECQSYAWFIMCRKTKTKVPYFPLYKSTF